MEIQNVEFVTQSESVVSDKILDEHQLVHALTSVLNVRRFLLPFSLQVLVLGQKFNFSSCFGECVVFW